jgi:hypothetical protein
VLLAGMIFALFEMARMNYLRVQQNALLQPAEIIRRAPPFEGVPFLYDNRQTVSHALTSNRFAVVVFKNGVQDSQLIPIDLPAGPDYAVKPIVVLAIDLWCGTAGMLARRAGCDGQISLPEPDLDSSVGRIRQTSIELVTGVGNSIPR